MFSSLYAFQLSRVISSYITDIGINLFPDDEKFQDMPSLNLPEASASIKVSASDTQIDLIDDVSRDLTTSHNYTSTSSDSPPRP